MNILFICTGNTCRSPLAAEIGRVMAEDRGLDYTFSSAGIYADIGCFASMGSIDAAQAFGGDLSYHQATSLTEDMIEDADLVLTMTQGHKNTLVLKHPQYKDKIFTIKEYAGESGDIDDPFGQGVEVYNQVAEEIAGLLNKILK